MTNDDLQKLKQETITYRRLTVEEMNRHAASGAFEWMQGAAMLQYTAKVLDALDALRELRAIHNKTADLFDALGIWTGADDLLWDRLIYLLSGMADYCDPAKTNAIVDKVQKQWSESK